MMNPPIPHIDLTPSAASMATIPGVDPIHLKAIEAEATKGTEQASFRIPGRMKTLINRICLDPRFAFQGQPARFYQQAIATHLARLRPFYEDDIEYTQTVDALKAASDMLVLTDLVGRFEDLLAQYGERYQMLMVHDDTQTVLDLLDVVIKTVQSVEGPQRIAMAKLMRGDRAAQDAVRYVMKSEGVGLTKKASAVQLWMNDSE